MRAKKLLTSRQILRYAVPARTVTKSTAINKQKNTQAYPTHKACLCHKQDGKLLRVL